MKNGNSWGSLQHQLESLEIKGQEGTEIMVNMEKNMKRVTGPIFRGRSFNGRLQERGFSPDAP